MLLQFTNGKPFATGTSSYLYQPVTPNETAPRILLHVLLGKLETFAFVDTGGVYFLCVPDMALHLGLYPEDSIGSLNLLFRGVSYFGHLHRIPLTFMAEEGRPLMVEVTWSRPACRRPRRPCCCRCPGRAAP